MKAEDIVYTPLDLPPCPDVGIEKMNSWIKRVYPQTNLSALAHNRILGKNSNRPEYPWDAVFAKAMTWRDDFHTEFPEIVEYLASGWGFKDNEILGLILLPKRLTKESRGFWHSDADRLGLRFYIEFGNTQDDKLLFRKTLKHEVIENNLFRFFQDGTELEHKIRAATLLLNRQPFYINNYAAAHTVYNTSPQFRIAAIVGTTYETNKNPAFKEKIDKLIVDSAMKFHKEAIFWHDWTDGISR
jgi:hypothetical protein